MALITHRRFINNSGEHILGDMSSSAMKLEPFQSTVYNELEVQTLKQIFCQEEFSARLKLKILDWVFWFVFSLFFLYFFIYLFNFLIFIFFCFYNFWTFLLIYCFLLFSLFKRFWHLTSFFFCIFLLRFRSSVLAMSCLKERVQCIEKRYFPSCGSHICKQAWFCIWQELAPLSNRFQIKWAVALFVQKLKLKS